MAYFQPGPLSEILTITNQISKTPGAGFQPAQNLSSLFFEGSCAVMTTSTPQRPNQVLSKQPQDDPLFFRYITIFH